MKLRFGMVSFACALLALLNLAACASSPATTDKDVVAENEKPSSGGIFSRLMESSSSITLPAGTEIAVVLDQAISSEQARSGDPFVATVAVPVVIDGKTVMAKGTQVEGVVVEARASGRLKGVARLRLALYSVEIGAKSYPLHTTSITRTGQSHEKRNWVMIGGGSGAGAAIGAIAGGGKGAAIGAAVGAGAGTATAAATGKKDITIPAESQLTFKLEQPVTVTVKG